MESRKFRTKTGFCQITSDRIVFTRDGIVGDLSELSVGNGISRTLLIYGVISMTLLYLAYQSYLDNDAVVAIFLGALGLYLIYVIVKSRNYSTTPVIERSTIVETRFKKGIAGLTRSRFEVAFNDKGARKIRLIMLPGSLMGGQVESEAVLQMFREEELIE